MNVLRRLTAVLTSASLHMALVVGAPFEWPERPMLPPPSMVEAEEIGPLQVAMFEEPAPIAEAPAPPPPPAPIAETVVAPGPTPAPPVAAPETSPKKAAARTRAPRKDKKKACTPSDDIARSGEASWTVQRDLVDYYASNLRELLKIASVSRHSSNGKPDGFRSGFESAAGCVGET